jgi:phage FluMu gp28-like protein
MRFSGLHAGQVRILELPGRFRVAICGRRFGKTYLAEHMAVELCAARSRENPAQVWWISPVLEQSRRVEREMFFALVAESTERGASRRRKERAEWKYCKTERAFTHLKSGSRIEFHSAEQGDSLRGAGLDLAILDEAADIPEEMWNRVVKPMLLERQGTAFIVGTPRGTSNWLHKLFRLAEEQPGAPYGALRLPTRENPRVSEEDLELFRADMTDAEFRQEFGAEFLDGVNSVFPGVEQCAGGALLDRGRPGAWYVNGIDLGQTADYSVVVSLCGTNDAADRVRVEGFDRFKGLLWRSQVERLVEHVRRFPGPLAVDATGVGAPISEDLAASVGFAVHPVRFEARNKRDMIEGLKLAIEKKRIALPDCKELIGELQSYTQTGMTGAARTPQYGAPAGLHDDCVSALMLAYHGLTRMGLRGPSGNPWRERGWWG